VGVSRVPRSNPCGDSGERAHRSEIRDVSRRREVTGMKDLKLQLEELEARIAPSVSGTGGYDGQPGGQCNAKNNPSGSANPENGHH
jgi:hypothetical protein